ncbi:MAG: MFS transporter [Geodermatophilaceae bacterium]
MTAALLVRRLGETRAVGLAFVTFALSSAGFAASSLTVVAPAAVLGGVAIPWLIVGFVTARQRLTPPRLQGRVSAVTILSMNGPQTVSIALGAALISVVDYRLLIGVTSVVIAASGLWLLRYLDDSLVGPHRVPGAVPPTSQTAHETPVPPPHTAPFDDSYRRVTGGWGILHTARCCL